MEVVLGKSDKDLVWFHGLRGRRKTSIGILAMIASVKVKVKEKKVWIMILISGGVLVVKIL